MANTGHDTSKPSHGNPQKPGTREAAERIAQPANAQDSGVGAAGVSPGQADLEEDEQPSGRTRLPSAGDTDRDLG